MGLWTPSKEDVVIAVVALTAGGATFERIQTHEAWHRYAGRLTKPHGRDVMDALEWLRRRSLVRERGDRRWKLTLP